MNSFIKVRRDGTIIWVNGQGRYHREGDKPAYIDPKGFVAYFFNGDCHRENGPAKIWPSGHTLWFKYGKNIKLDQ